MTLLMCTLQISPGGLHVSLLRAAKAWQEHSPMSVAGTFGMQMYAGCKEKPYALQNSVRSGSS